MSCYFNIIIITVMNGPEKISGLTVDRTLGGVLSWLSIPLATDSIHLNFLFWLQILWDSTSIQLTSLDDR